MDTNTVLPNPSSLNFDYQNKPSSSIDLCNISNTSSISSLIGLSNTSNSSHSYTVCASTSVITSNISDLSAKASFASSMITPYSVQSGESDVTTLSPVTSSSKTLLHEIVQINAVKLFYK